jgi:putative membrane protein insertion efficiency factor
MTAHQAEAVTDHEHAMEEIGHEHEHAHEDEPSLREIPVTVQNLPRMAGLSLIRVYQATLSKAIPAGICRFYPTCSHYGYQAIVKHGLVKGSGLAIWRVARCQPFSKGGYDPVP